MVGSMQPTPHGRGPETEPRALASGNMQDLQPAVEALMSGRADCLERAIELVESTLDWVRANRAQIDPGLTRVLLNECRHLAALAGQAAAFYGGLAGVLRIKSLGYGRAVPLAVPSRFDLEA
jgi:hypothetical protein